MRTEVVFMILKDIIDSYKIPELQRLVDNEHIISMVEDQKKEYNKYNTFSMLQSFTIACITNEDAPYRRHASRDNSLLFIFSLQTYCREIPFVFRIIL
jgi:antitoxin component of RelBE/YafQ-DinJ toxin-antitoxin module